MTLTTYSVVAIIVFFVVGIVFCYSDDEYATNLMAALSAAVFWPVILPLMMLCVAFVSPLIIAKWLKYGK